MYNSFKEDRIQKYETILGNIYLNKTLKNIFYNLEPKYFEINHKITTGDTFDKILRNYDINDDEIEKIKKILKKNNNINNLEINQIIKFTIDMSKNSKIINFEFPINKTKKILLEKKESDESFVFEI